VETLFELGALNKMPDILVLYPIENVSNFIEDKKEIIWYDLLKHKMEKFKGTRLKWKYKYDNDVKQYRMIPEGIVDKIKKVVKKINKEKVNKWFDTYSKYNDTTATLEESNEEGIVFKINEKELQDFEYALYRNGLEYEEI